MMEKDDDIDEGDRIRLELEKRGKTVDDFAAACGVTWSGAKRYLAPTIIENGKKRRSNKIGETAWETCKNGLIMLGIDPELIRPTGIEKKIGETKTTAEALKQELSAFGGQDQLRILRKMLGAPDAVRRSVIDAIDGALLWRRNRG